MIEAIDPSGAKITAETRGVRQKKMSPVVQLSKSITIVHRYNLRKDDRDSLTTNGSVTGAVPEIMGMSLRGRWVESIPLSEINNTYGSGKYQKNHSYPRDGCITEELVMPCISYAGTV